MTLAAARCPACGAPIGVDALGGLEASCRYCGVAFLPASGVPRATAIVLERIGPAKIDTIREIRRFSGLGLAEVMRALEGLPATFSIADPKIAAAEALARLVELGCVASLAAERAVLPSDPAFAAHDGTWGFRIESDGQAKIEAIKLVREIADVGLAEAKRAVETPRTLIPIARRATHEEIRRRFAAIGYAVSFSPVGG